MAKTTTIGQLRKAAKRFTLFFAVWLVISEARADLIAFGVFACLITTLVSYYIWRSEGSRVRLWTLLSFVPGFLWRSLKGGVDVLWRVMHPSMPVRPAFLVHSCDRDDEAAKVMFCDVLSLMPGTLGAGIEGKRAVIHVLFDDEAVQRALQEEEKRVLEIFAGTGAGGREGD